MPNLVVWQLDLWLLGGFIIKEQQQDDAKFDTIVSEYKTGKYHFLLVIIS